MKCVICGSENWETDEITDSYGHPIYITFCRECGDVADAGP